MLALLLIAAQPQTSTRCTTSANVTNCDSTPTFMPDQPPPDFSGIRGALERRAARKRAHKLADLIATGDCTGARTLALEDGNYEAARYIDASCKPK